MCTCYDLAPPVTGGYIASHYKSGDVILKFVVGSQKVGNNCVVFLVWVLLSLIPRSPLFFVLWLRSV